MAVSTPSDVISGTWMGTIIYHGSSKQQILLEMKNGVERIDVTTSAGKLVATGDYEFSGDSLKQAIKNITLHGAFNGPSLATVNGTHECKVAGNTLEIDIKALPLDRDMASPVLDKIVLTRVSGEDH